MAEIILKGICTTNEFETFERRLFEKLETLTELQINTKEWFTSKEAMEYLGIKETKFYALINKGIIKQYNLDGSKRYLRSELFDAIFKNSNC